MTTLAAPTEVQNIMASITQLARIAAVAESRRSLEGSGCERFKDMPTMMFGLRLMLGDMAVSYEAAYEDLKQRQ